MKPPGWAQFRRLPGHGVQQVCAVALAAIGTFALASLIPFLAAGRPATARFPLNVLYAPAWFLFDSFLWFSLLIPALCYGYVFALFSDRVTREMLASLAAIGLVLPVLGTLSHVVLGTDRALAAVELVEAFGRAPAAILLILVLMLEGVAGFALLKHWRERSRRAGAATPHGALPAPDASHGEPGSAPPAYANGQVEEPKFATNGMAHTAEHRGPPHAEPSHAEPSHAGPPHAGPPHTGPPHTEPSHAEPPHAEPSHTGPQHAGPQHAGPPATTGGLASGHGVPLVAAEELSAPEEPAASQFPDADADTVPGPDYEDPDTPDTPDTPADAPFPDASAPGMRREPDSAPTPVESGRRSRSRRRGYHVPLEVLNAYKAEEPGQVENDTREAAATLMATLAEFRIDAEVTGVRRGPVITMFELLPAPGVKISRIVNLADNIALRLAASRVRIVAPIPGKHAVGIEVPNRHRSVVGFRDIVSLKEFRAKPGTVAGGVPIVLGKDITGEAQVIDLTATPHLLIAGATGAGKSVLVNALICSVLYSRTPEQVRLLLIDPKIVELKLYNDVPHLLTPVITDPKRAFQALQYCQYEMERRYALLDNLGVRDIRSYNRRLAERRDKLTVGPLPYLVIVIDEFADLMATTGKELEATLARLAAMARAVGIHIVLATQRPSIDVITGLIKANIPSRIAFMVASKFDSRIIIDAVGAEKLLGRGDMLFVPAWDANPLRIQGALVSEDEVERITEKVRELGEPDYVDEDLMFDDDEAELVLEPGGNDPMMDQALEIVVAAGKASASFLQRKLKIGYNRAARLVEEMEQRGIVGPANGSKPREILHIPNRDKG